MSEHEHDEGISTIDRVEAARLLRDARAERERGEAGDAVDWAFAALPDRRHARRLKVERLLRERDLEGAESLIAQGLLQRPNDAPLMLLRARCLLIRGHHDEADAEIDRVLRQRPHHAATLVVAAEVARGCGDLTTAIARLEHAVRTRPGHDGLAGRLAGMLLDADRTEQAALVIDRMTDAPALLRARLLRDQGRPLDAVELLEAARVEEDPDEAIMCALIDGLESIEAYHRLHDLLATIDAGTPRALLRAGRTWLRLSSYERAIDALAPLRKPGPHQREARSIGVVAAAMLGRLGQAEQMLARLQESSTGADPRLMAELWRRALTAHLFVDQARTGRVAAGPGRRLLDPLLKAALEVFETEPTSRTPARRAEIQRHRAVCLAALGRQREASAMTAVAVAEEIGPLTFGTAA